MGENRAVRFEAEVWDYKGEGGWHFLTLPEEVGDDVRERTAGLAKGFGSVPVAATIGETTWETSVFPDKQSGSYVLPLKRSVREAEGLAPGVVAEVSLRLRV